MQKNSKNDDFSQFFKSDLRSAKPPTGCGTAGGRGESRTIEILNFYKKAAKFKNFAAFLFI